MHIWSTYYTEEWSFIEAICYINPLGIKDEEPMAFYIHADTNKHREDMWAVSFFLEIHFTNFS